MARVDDYVNAKAIAAERLATVAAADIARFSGLELVDHRTFRVRFLNRTYDIGYPSFDFVDAANASEGVPIQEQVLILHYIGALNADRPAGRWIAYREIPGASFYFSAFVKRAIDPLKNIFGKNIAPLVASASKLNGVPIDIGDAGFEFWLFPKVPLRIILHAGDDEFEPEANILFDASAGQFLSPEDAAWLAGMLVYRLAALSR